MPDFWERFVERYERIDPLRMERYLRSLAREKGLLESVFQSISEAIIVLNKDGRIMFINRTARDMLGITSRHVENKALSKYIQDPELASFFDEHGVFHGETPVSSGIKISRPREMQLQVNVFPFVMDSQEEGTIVVIKDITEQHRRQMDAFQSEKLGALSTLAAGVAHEIGNPLNSIGIHMQLMEKDIRKIKDGDTRERLSEYVESAKTEISRLDKMIRTFLTAVRPASLNLQEHNVNHILENVLDFLYYEISDKNVAIEKNYSGKVPLIPLDEAQMRQAFFNIIKNAVEAMPDGGSLGVTTRILKDEVVIVFEDTGQGMDEQSLSRVFEPYYTTKQKGSGLGLMIVYKIVSDHRGRIEVESQKGRGTRITIHLPIYERKTRMLKDQRVDTEEGQAQ